MRSVQGEKGQSVRTLAGIHGQSRKGNIQGVVDLMVATLGLPECLFLLSDLGGWSKKEKPVGTVPFLSIIDRASCKHHLDNRLRISHGKHRLKSW